jgi:hypothetical protein
VNYGGSIAILGWREGFQLAKCGFKWFDGCQLLAQSLSGMVIHSILHSDVRLSFAPLRGTGVRAFHLR